MDRSRLLTGRYFLLLLGLVVLSTTGCAKIIATGLFIVGGNAMPAECNLLEEKRVVVVCRPPYSVEYRHAGVDRSIAKQVGRLLSQNVPGIDVVDYREVEDWADQRDIEDVRELARDLNAQIVLRIDLESFRLIEDPTLYKGRANTLLTVIDMEKEGEEVWEKNLGEVLYPVNSEVASQGKQLASFRREFLNVLSRRVATYFYSHDPNDTFASDSIAHH